MGKLEDKATKDWVRGLQEDAGYRRMRKFQSAAAKAGTDYDYKSANEAGMKPDPKSGHGYSRVPSGPKEGLLLKHPRHPSFGLGVYHDVKLGGHVYKKDKRLYTK